MKKFFIICAVLFTIFAIVNRPKNLSEEPSLTASEMNEKLPAIETFLNDFYSHYNSQDYDYIYNNLATVYYRQNVWRETSKVYLEDNYGGLGGLVKIDIDNKKSLKINKVKIRTQQDAYHLNFKATFEKGTATQNFHLVEEDNQIKMATFLSLYRKKNK